MLGVLAAQNTFPLAKPRWGGPFARLFPKNDRQAQVPNPRNDPPNNDVHRRTTNRLGKKDEVEKRSLLCDRPRQRQARVLDDRDYALPLVRLVVSYAAFVTDAKDPSSCRAGSGQALLNRGTTRSLSRERSNLSGILIPCGIVLMKLQM